MNEADGARTPQTPSYGIPIAILVAIGIEVIATLARLALPMPGRLSSTYWLVSSGTYGATALLTAMGLAELVRRLPPQLATGARIAMIGYAVFVAMSLVNGLTTIALMSLGNTAEIVWQVRMYISLATSLAICAGLVVAAGGVARVAPAVIGLVVTTLVLYPPPFLSVRIHELFGASTRYVYPVVGLAHLAAQTFLIREAARSSTYPVYPEPTAPFALLGTSLRARVIATFVLVGFTLFAVGGRSLGLMKVALVGAPIINIAAFVVFAVAAARAAGGLDDKLQWMFGLAAGATAWCASVLAMQTVAVFQMLNGSSDSWLGERNVEMARALGITMPFVATAGVVLALVAVGAHVRKLGHHAVATKIGPHTTMFVVLMIVSVLIQIYGVPKAKSSGELVVFGILSAVAGVIALLTAANVFKSSSEATSSHALPTATVLS